MFPVEFVVIGPPVSHQSNNRALLREWQEAVRAAALAAASDSGPPVARECRLSITYVFLTTPVRVDADNLAKPISDALNGIVFVDDWWVAELVVRRRHKETLAGITGGSPPLLAGLAGDEDFVLVRAEEASWNTP